MSTINFQKGKILLTFFLFAIKREIKKNCLQNIRNFRHSVVISFCYSIKYFEKGIKRARWHDRNSLRAGLIKTFSTYFISTLTRHLLTLRWRQDTLLFNVRILEIQHNSSVLFATTCTHRETIIYANKIMLLIVNLSFSFGFIRFSFFDTCTEINHWNLSCGFPSTSNRSTFQRTNELKWSLMIARVCFFVAFIVSYSITIRMKS